MADISLWRRFLMGVDNSAVLTREMREHGFERQSYKPCTM
jgi:hypothetical protein